MCRALLALTALHARGLVAWAIRGDRRLCGSWLSVPPAPRVRGGCSWGFWLEQEHADHPPVVMDALDLVSVALELGHDGGREVSPAGMQSGKSDRLVAGPVQRRSGASMATGRWSRCACSIQNLPTRSTKPSAPVPTACASWTPAATFAAPLQEGRAAADSRGSQPRPALVAWPPASLFLRPVTAPWEIAGGSLIVLR